MENTNKKKHLPIIPLIFTTKYVRPNQLPTYGLQSLGHDFLLCNNTRPAVPSETEHRSHRFTHLYMMVSCAHVCAGVYVCWYIHV